jgi:hypothetical protein
MKPFSTIHRLCIVDGSYGIYVPQRYAEICNASDMATEEQREILLAGPDHADYWDTWVEVLDNTVVQRGGRAWRLEQDSDVFLVAD